MSLLQFPIPIPVPFPFLVPWFRCGSLFLSEHMQACASVSVYIPVFLVTTFSWRFVSRFRSRFRVLRVRLTLTLTLPCLLQFPAFVRLYIPPPSPLRSPFILPILFFDFRLCSRFCFRF